MGIFVKVVAVCVSETWLALKVLDSEIYIDGYSYTSVRKDRVHTNIQLQGTGIIVCIKNVMDYTVRSDLLSDALKAFGFK